MRSKVFIVIVAAFATSTSMFAQEKLRDKTLIAWVAPANLDQRGGSVLTIDDRQSRFDGIIFGELARARWMAGSENFNRTRRDQAAWAEETASAGRIVQIAVIYRDRTITIVRDGQPIANYELETGKQPLEFGSNAVVIAGMRHLDQGDESHFAGEIEELRVYDTPLSPEQLRSLKPNDSAGPHPWALWDFESDSREKSGRFAATRLSGGARIKQGRLVLDGKTGAMFAARTESELERMVPPGPPIPPDVIENVRRFRNRLLADKDRPAYHFVIPEDYAMPFDPNGAIFWKGRYHLFYIYQERGAHSYGHVSSVDLIHWRHHPPAFVPKAAEPDKGMFSGNCFVDRDGRATMLYHGVDAGNCIATSTDELLESWTKLPSNPIVPNPPPGALFRSWDPHGWKEGNTYYAIFGGERAAVFKAQNLNQWTYVGDLLHHSVPGVDLREDISCPDLFTIGGKRVLVCISHRLGARYYVGEWKDEQFHPEVHERMSWSDNLYFAPESLEDPKGRRIMWAWVFDQRSGPARKASGWSGEMALPRELTLGPDNRLRMRPVEELKRLRYDKRTFGPFDLATDSEKIVDGLTGDTLELEVEIEPRGAAKFGLHVRRSPDGSEKMSVYVDKEHKRFGINQEAGPFQSDAKAVTIRVFLDRSIVEAFAEDRQAVVRRCYPSRTDSLGISVFSVGGPARIRRLTAWKMFPSNPF